MFVGEGAKTWQSNAVKGDLPVMSVGVDAEDVGHRVEERVSIDRN